MADWEEAALVARQLWAEWRVDAADRKPYQRWQFRRYYGSQESLADWEAASRLPSGDRRSAPSEDRCDEDLPRLMRRKRLALPKPRCWRRQRNSSRPSWRH